MFAICIEGSHQRGMGHVFRAIQFVEYLKRRNEPYIILVNNDKISKDILINANMPFEVVNLLDYDSNWEKAIIRKYNVTIWFNDRMSTDIRHSKHIKAEGIKLITMDDQGTGAEIADINFGGMSIGTALKGREVFLGTEYLILNTEIEQYRRIRNEVNKIVVTLGGSDTYGVTIKVVKILKDIGKAATIIIGPNFKHEEDLTKVINEKFKVKRNVPSLIKEFSQYDLAITGGGVTPFEANAMGLPCIIIANELHEIPIGEYLEKLGGAIFAGYYKEIREEIFSEELDIEKMSRKALSQITLNGTENIYNLIMKG